MHKFGRKFNLYCGDSIKILKEIPSNSIDSIVCDPPYGIKFLANKWDCNVPSVDIWKECLRVLKPGGHLLAFAGTRTQHRMASNIEDAGFEIRDMLAWAYGSGFPKSLNVSKAISAQNTTGGSSPRNLRKARLGDNYSPTGQKDYKLGRMFSNEIESDVIDTEITNDAMEFNGWGTALKPAMEPITLARKPLKSTVAENVLEYKTGAINVDGCRIGDEVVGRWPANIIHDGSKEIIDAFGDSSRFFYCPKASKKDKGNGNSHPTVKPTDLMKYLCRLITPIGGTILDPFMGSGSTGKAAILEGFQFIGIDISEEYVVLSEKRISECYPTNGVENDF